MKKTRSKPTYVVNNITEIPEELLEIQQDAVLLIDRITISPLDFLSTISHESFYRTTQYVQQPLASIY